MSVWYRVTVEGDGSKLTYLEEQFPQARQYDYFDIVEVKKVKIDNLTGQEIVQMLSDHFESENYHSLTALPGKIYKLLVELEGEYCATKFMRHALEDGMFSL